MQAGTLLEQLNIGAVESYENLHFVRVFGKDRLRQKVVTVQDAFATHQFGAQESGEVACLLVQNNLDQIVFVADGSIFEGQSQNRASHYPLLIRAHSGITRVPVRCVEHGQGLIGGSQYHGSSTIVMPSVRSGMVGQGHTWNSIDQTMTSLGRSSHTQDYVEVVRNTNLADYLKAMGDPLPEQRGYIATVVNGGVRFFADIFGTHDLYSRLAKLLHEGVAAVAKQHNTGTKTRIERTQFVAFLDEARQTDIEPVKLEGDAAGETYVMKAPVTGSALAYQGAPVQVSLRKDGYTHEERPRAEAHMTRIWPRQ